MKPRKPMDLAPIPINYPTNQSAEDFALDVQTLHRDIRDKIRQKTESVESYANALRMFPPFSVGDQVLVRNRPERFPMEPIRNSKIKPWDRSKFFESEDRMLTYSIYRRTLHVVLFEMLRIFNLTMHHYQPSNASPENTPSSTPDPP